MIERELLVANKLGLHARATAKLVQLLSGYRCNARCAHAAARSTPKASWA
jgi:phosphocarrier protein HPr